MNVYYHMSISLPQIRRYVPVPVCVVDLKVRIVSLRKIAT